MVFDRSVMLSVAWVLAVVVGCNGGGRTIDTGASAREQRVPPELVARSRTWVPDIPVPLRFELDQDRSRSWATQGVRVVNHRYKGPSEKREVGRFYERHMKAKGWTAVSDRMIRGIISLRFVKGKERCEVDITDDGWKGSEVYVNIFPEANAVANRQY